MSLETFTPPIEPTVNGLPTKTKPRILKADFGDGYSQRAGDGINNLPREATLSWESVTGSQADVIEAFFEATGGYLAFYYTLPWELTARKWYATDWERNPKEYDDFSFSATVKEVFDLV